MTTSLPVGMADRVRATILEGPQALSRSWFVGRGGIVVPLPEFRGFSEAEGTRLVAAAVSLGVSEIWGMFTEAGGNQLLGESDGQVLQVAQREIDTWDRPHGVFDSMVVVPDLAFAVVQTIDEFGLVGGPLNAVEIFLGTSIGHAYREFMEYAEDMRSASSHLPGIARRYAPG